MTTLRQPETAPCVATGLEYWRVATLVISALSLSPSFAHVLEAYPRLSLWSAELWRETTVFNGQYLLFAVIGAPIDVGAVIAAGLLAYVSRRDRYAARWAALGAIFAAASLLVWFEVVAAANAVLATWQPGPIPPQFEQVRNQWEFGHMAVASLKFLSLVSLAISRVRDDKTPGPKGKPF